MTSEDKRTKAWVSLTTKGVNTYAKTVLFWNNLISYIDLSPLFNNNINMRLFCVKKKKKTYIIKCYQK